MARLWTRPFIQMTVSLLLFFTAFYLLVPTMPLYVIELGGNDSLVGLAAGVFTITAVLFRPIVGGLLDQYGRRLFVLFGMAVFALSMYLYNWVGGIALLLVLRIVHGFGWAFSTTAAGTAVTDMIPESRRGEGLGWYGLAMTGAMAIGPMLGTWTLQNHAFWDLFLVATGLSVVALFLAAATPMPFTPKSTRRKLALYDPSLVPIMVAVAFLSVAYGGLITFLPLFAASIDVNAGVFFLLYAATLTVIRPIAGKLSDRHGESSVILPATAVAVLALLTIALSRGVFGVVAAAVLYGAGYGAAQPALQAATIRLVRPDRIGVANASFFTAFDLGIALGAAALGGVAQAFGYRTLFVTCAVSVAVSLAVFTSAVRARLAKQHASAGA